MCWFLLFLLGCCWFLRFFGQIDHFTLRGCCTYSLFILHPLTTQLKQKTALFIAKTRKRTDIRIVFNHRLVWHYFFDFCGVFKMTGTAYGFQFRFTSADWLLSPISSDVEPALCETVFCQWISSNSAFAFSEWRRSFCIFQDVKQVLKQKGKRRFWSCAGFQNL